MPCFSCAQNLRRQLHHHHPRAQEHNPVAGREGLDTLKTTTNAWPREEEAPAGPEPGKRTSPSAAQSDPASFAHGNGKGVFTSTTSAASSGNGNARTGSWHGSSQAILADGGSEYRATTLGDGRAADRMPSRKQHRSNGAAAATSFGGGGGGGDGGGGSVMPPERRRPEGGGGDVASSAEVAAVKEQVGLCGVSASGGCW